MLVAEKTVKNNVSHLLAKLRMTSRTQIAVRATEGRLELRDFGVFEVRVAKARKARNPRTGEKIMVGERVTVTFKPGRVVEDRVAMEYGGDDGVLAGG